MYHRIMHASVQDRMHKRKYTCFQKWGHKTTTTPTTTKRDYRDSMPLSSQQQYVVTMTTHKHWDKIQLPFSFLNPSLHAVSKPETSI